LELLTWRAGSTTVIASDGTCTRRAVTPSAAARACALAREQPTQHRPAAIVERHQRLKVYADFGAKLREFDGEPEHVHMLVNFPLAAAICWYIEQ